MQMETTKTIDFERMAYLISRIPNKILWKLIQARSAAEKITSSITGMPHGSGGFHSQVEDGAIKILGLEEAYKEAFDELSGYQAQLEPLVKRLEDPIHVGTLRLRYFDGYSVSEISHMTGRSRSTVNRDLREAQNKVNFMAEL